MQGRRAIWVAAVMILSCRDASERAKVWAMTDETFAADKPLPAESVKIGRFTIPLPRSPWLRITIGVLLCLGGVFSILPFLGIWMLPLGLLVLSIDIPRVRRWRRRFAVWFTRRYPRLAAKFNPPKPDTNGAIGNDGRGDVA